MLGGHIFKACSEHAGDIDYEAVVKLAENFNGADLRNVCTEGGMFAIRDERDYIVQVSFTGPKSIADFVQCVNRLSSNPLVQACNCSGEVS